MQILWRIKVWFLPIFVKKWWMGGAGNENQWKSGVWGNENEFGISRLFLHKRIWPDRQKEVFFCIRKRSREKKKSRKYGLYV